ncbi:MAG: hypothetical protein AAF490_01185 [Chloroflexota bacterium]
MIKQKSILCLLILFLLAIEVPFVLAEEADTLPEDNLIINPWFRDETNTTASHDGWEITDAWGLSQKNTNPTPDDVVGTSARIGTPKASYNEDHRMSQIIEADESQPVLLFQMWQVSRSLVELDATIYVSDSPDGPWEPVWTPWNQQLSSVHWMQTPLFEAELDRGYPYYKLDLSCNYSHGIAGCKFSGVYFTVTDQTGQGIEAGSQTELANASDNNRGTGGSNNNRLALEGLGLESVTATAVSAQEIEILWPEHDRVDATYQIERSLSGRGNWQLVDAVSADEWAYVDAGLLPNTEYFYRIQVNFEGGGRTRTAIFSASTLSEFVDEPPVEETAVAEEPPSIEPIATNEPAPEPIGEPTVIQEPAVEEPSIEPEPTPAPVTTNSDSNVVDQYGLVLIGFGLGALLVGGIWSITRRKTN